jgi:hypothetical protein
MTSWAFDIVSCKNIQAYRTAVVKRSVLSSDLTVKALMVFLYRYSDGLLILQAFHS